MFLALTHNTWAQNDMLTFDTSTSHSQNSNIGLYSGFTRNLVPRQITTTNVITSVS